MIKIATPISHLLKDNEDFVKIGMHSDCWECRDRSFDSIIEKQEVFHCDLQPIHNIADEQLEYLEKIRNNKPDLKLITFHCASNCDQPIINKDGMFELGGRKYSKIEMLENAKKNFSIIKKIFGNNVKIGIENNNYFDTPAYEYVTDPEFISRIVYDNELEFLFDIAHAKVTCHNRKLSFIDYKKKLPLDRIIQVHVCRYGIDNNGLAYDAHDLPGQEEIEDVLNLANNYNVLYITIEFYKDKVKLINCLKEIKKIL